MGLIVSHFNEQVSLLHKLIPSEFIDASTLCRVFGFFQHSLYNACY